MTSRQAVVVGVDGSPSSRTALDWAAAIAAAEHRELRVIYALSVPPMPVPLAVPPLGPQADELRDAVHRFLQDAVDRARQAHPGLEASGAVIDGQPAAVLHREAQQARLVVIGSRGLGGFSGLLLGSTGVTLSAHSPCPVVVVREASSTGDVVVGVDGSARATAAVVVVAVRPTPPSPWIAPSAAAIRNRPSSTSSSRAGSSWKAWAICAA